jgi:hypothetical protein
MRYNPDYKWSATPPWIDDGEDHGAEWARASMEERGMALAVLLTIMDAYAPHPPKGEMFPGWKKIMAEAKERRAREHENQA